MDPVFDIHGQVLCDIIVKVADTDGLCDVLDCIAIPEGHYFGSSRGVWIREDSGASSARGGGSADV